MSKNFRNFDPKFFRDNSLHIPKIFAKAHTKDPQTKDFLEQYISCQRAFLLKFVF